VVEVTNHTLQSVSKQILNQLTEVIRHKEHQLRFSNVSDLMYHYLQGDMVQNKKFIYYLEKVADDQLTVKE
jgi:tRNA G18 (ribose-2'-O)-methylase SpoU